MSKGMDHYWNGKLPRCLSKDLQATLDWLDGSVPNHMLVLCKARQKPVPEMGDNRGVDEPENTSVVKRGPATGGAEKAPMWRGRALHSEWPVEVSVPPAEALAALLAMVQRISLPSQFSTVEPWKVRGVVFVDFVALGAEVRICADPSDPGAAVVVFRDTSAADAVRFAQFVRTAAAQLSQQGLEATSRSGCNLRPADDDDFDCDFDAEFDGDLWPVRIDAMLAQACSANAVKRKESWQMLALWGQNCIESRKHLALGLSRLADAMLDSVLKRPEVTLAELYPMSAAITFAALSRRGSAGVGGEAPPKPDAVSREWLAEALRSFAK